MNESDYHQINWERDLMHKHSPAGARERKINSIRRRGKKWYARKGMWAGLFAGLIIGYLIFQITMKPNRLETGMKDTPLPLSLAFIDDTGEITEIVDLSPFDETKYTSQRPARYCLEVNQGWFDARNILPGAKITLVGR